MLDTVTTLPLKDGSLLRQANLLDGRWIDADDGKTVPVTNPANGAVIGTVPAVGATLTPSPAANAAAPCTVKIVGAPTAVPVLVVLPVLVVVPVPVEPLIAFPPWFVASRLLKDRTRRNAT